MKLSDDDEIVRVATGELVQVEMWQQHLAEAGIECRVVGSDLDASFGSALLGSMELWVHRDDAARAEQLLREIVEGSEGTAPA